MFFELCTKRLELIDTNLLSDICFMLYIAKCTLD